MSLSMLSEDLFLENINVKNIEVNRGGQTRSQWGKGKVRTRKVKGVGSLYGGKILFMALSRGVKRIKTGGIWKHYRVGNMEPSPLSSLNSPDAL